MDKLEKIELIQDCLNNLYELDTYSKYTELNEAIDILIDLKEKINSEEKE